MAVAERGRVTGGAEEVRVEESIKNNRKGDVLTEGNRAGGVDGGLGKTWLET